MMIMVPNADKQKANCSASDYVIVAIFHCFAELKLYLVHNVEFWHIKFGDRNEIWAQDLYHSKALVEAVKSLAPSKYKRTWQSTVPKTSATKVYGAWRIPAYSAMYWRNAQCQLNVNRV